MPSLKYLVLEANKKPVILSKAKPRRRMTKHMTSVYDTQVARMRIVWYGGARKEVWL